MTSTPDADPRLTGAHDLALAALREITPASTIGPPAGYLLEDDGSVSLRFENRLPGYPGWYWTVTVARVDDAEPTVLEAELMPAEGALLAPEWIPWAERLAEYRANQAELAEQAAAAESGEAGDSEGESSDADEDIDLDEDDLDEDDDLDDDVDLDEDDDDLDEDDPTESRLLHAGDLDGVDIDELDDSVSDDEAIDDESDDEFSTTDDDESDDASDDEASDDASGEEE